MVTYFDSTTKQLPFLSHNFNFINPDQWKIISSGYNDNSNVSAPYPKVALNMSQQKGADVWIGEGISGNGIAMFDALYSTYTGISENKTKDFNRIFWIFPNPCSSLLNIDFELKSAEKVTIFINTLIGKTLEIVTDQTFPAGRQVLKYNVSDIPSGSYLISMKTGNDIETYKLLIIR